jgi:predicted nucleic acid-binding protein
MALDVVGHHGARVLVFPTSMGTHREWLDRRMHEVLADHLELADRFGLYAYDAYLMACARQQGAPLLTLDPRLGRAAHEAGVRVIEV